MKNLDLEIFFRDFNHKSIGVAVTENDHRFNSFDFCYNYFSSFVDKQKIASEQNIETSCLQLGFYLASWGMYRGSSELLNRSLSFYIPLIKTIAECDNGIWDIDVDSYGNEVIREKIILTYRKICHHLPNKSTITLGTKIMLGVFGNVPAYDRYFKIAITKLSKSDCRFNVLNHRSLKTIYNFYIENQEFIDSLAKRSITKKFGFQRNESHPIPRAKIIDILGFQYGLEMNRYELPTIENLSINKKDNVI